MIDPGAVRTEPTAREIRAEIRAWRKGRTQLAFWQAFGDVYVALFTVAMLGSMIGNVVLGLRRTAGNECLHECADVRSAAPWVLGLTAMVVILGVARILGPVSSAPAMNAWVLSSPVDRGDLLTPTITRAATLSAAGAVVLLVVPATVSGFSPTAAVAYLAAGASSGVLVVMVAARDQVTERMSARVLTWAFGGAVALAALLLSVDHDAMESLTSTPPSPTDFQAYPLAVVAVALAGLASGSLLVARRAVARMSVRVLGQTEHLSASLSGALASLDPRLAYDVLLARRWGRAATVRSRRGGPTGWAALVHRDAARALRSPQPWWVLAATVIVPYGAAAAGAGRLTPAIITLGGALVGPALCSGLRVASRTTSIERMLPQSRRTLRLAHLAVPGVALCAYTVACFGALPAEPAAPDRTLMLAACALSCMAASARWVTATPTNYAAPLVSTPGGGVPTGLVLGVFRGFDVWLVTSLPLLFPGDWGPWLSVAISVGVIAWVVEGRRA